jgi:hypothetical protein
MLGVSDGDADQLIDATAWDQAPDLTLREVRRQAFRDAFTVMYSEATAVQKLKIDAYVFTQADVDWLKARLPPRNFPQWMYGLVARFLLRRLYIVRIA